MGGYGGIELGPEAIGVSGQELSLCISSAIREELSTSLSEHIHLWYFGSWLGMGDYGGVEVGLEVIGVSGQELFPGTPFATRESEVET